MSKSKQLKPGQHLMISNGLYTHHGIYVGAGRVIHYAGKSNGLFDDSCSHVQESTLEEFAGHRTLYKVPEPEAKFTPNEIVLRAKSRLGENRYSVITNNCEHFVNWCVHDEHSSEQVKHASDIVADAISNGATAVHFYHTTKTASNIVNTARIVAAASSSSKAGLLASAASGSSAAGATVALTASGTVASGTTAGLVAGSSILATPLAPVAAVALITGGVVYGVGKLFDFW